MKKNSLFSIVILMCFSHFANAAEESPTETELAVMNERNIVIIGASYARSWPLQQVECLKVVNKSKDGEQSSEVNQRFEKDAFESDPEAVIIWGFINDLHRSPKEDIDKTKEIAKKNMMSMVEATLANNKIPVLATEVTLGISEGLKWQIMSFIGKLRGKVSYQEFINSNVLSVNNWMREYAKEKGLLILDIEKVLTNKKGNRKEGFAQIDGSHITELAYAAITREMTPVLETGLVNRNALCNSVAANEEN